MLLELCQCYDSDVGGFNDELPKMPIELTN